LDPDLSISWGIFFENKGDNLVTFEIMELEKLKNKVAPIIIEKEVDDFVDENDAMVSESRDGNAASVVEVEEIKVVTKLTMASRKLKIKFLMSC
jgi:DNA polymerase-3 subunit alpha